MTPRRWFVDAAVRGLLVPGVAGRYRLLTVWAICTAGVALLLTAVGYAAIGHIAQTASGQFARLHDEALSARTGPPLAVERVAARVLQPLLLRQAARVEAELQQLEQGLAPATLLAPGELPLRLPAVPGDSVMLAGGHWRAEYAATDSSGRGFALVSPAGSQFYAIDSVSARWLRIETLPTARGFIVRADGMVLALGIASNPAANVPGPLTGGAPLPTATEELAELTKRIDAGEAGTRLVTDSAGVLWVVAYAPLHELGGSYGLLMRRNDLAPELDAYTARVTASVAAGDDLVQHRARRYSAVLLYLLAAAWFIAVVGGWVVIRMLDLRRR